MAGTKTLVTGGCGRIGRQLVQRLVDEGGKVTVIDPKHGDVKGVKYITAPLDELEKLPGFDFVYHLAATIDYRASKERLEELNVKPTERLLELLPRCGQFILMSTTSVYAESAGPISELSPTEPYNNYGWSKLEAENVVRESGVPYTIIRSSQVYGPEFEEGFVQVLAKIQKGEMKIFGDGKNFVPLVHIKDLIDALLMVKGEEEAKNQIYNVDGGYERTQEELIEMAARAMDGKVPFEHVNPSVAKIFGKFTGKKGMVEEYIDKLTRNRKIAIDKIKKLGFEPKVGLETGLKEVVESFRQAGLLK